MEPDEPVEFSEQAIDHATLPRNYGPLPQSNGFAEITGPCGDTMWFWVHVSDGVVKDVAFMTNGCGSSLACGSMTTCLAKGASLGDVQAMTQADVLKALGGLPPDFEHCALLAVNTLHAACKDYSSNQSSMG
jgi:nitrogen fixation NifU-like protein